MARQVARSVRIAVTGHSTKTKKIAGWNIDFFDDSITICLFNPEEIYSLSICNYQEKADVLTKVLNKIPHHVLKDTQENAISQVM